METEFLVGSEFNGGPCRKLRLVETPHGQVVAYKNVVDSGPSYKPQFFSSQFFSSTVVPGFYRGERLTGGLRRMTVDTVPQEQQADVSKILRRQGYREPIAFR